MLFFSGKTLDFKRINPGFTLLDSWHWHRRFFGARFNPGERRADGDRGLLEGCPSRFPSCEWVALKKRKSPCKLLKSLVQVVCNLQKGDKPKCKLTKKTLQKCTKLTLGTWKWIPGKRFLLEIIIFSFHSLKCRLTTPYHLAAKMR